VRRSRLHVTGASGCGTTTLARAVADAWAVPHADADDYFWLPTDPPYVRKRPVEERLALMGSVFVPREAWVLSGSMLGGRAVRRGGVPDPGPGRTAATHRGPRARPSGERHLGRGGVERVPYLGSRVRRPVLRGSQPGWSRRMGCHPDVSGPPPRQLPSARGAARRGPRVDPHGQLNHPLHQATATGTSLIASWRSPESSRVPQADPLTGGAKGRSPTRGRRDWVDESAVDDPPRRPAESP